MDFIERLFHVAPDGGNGTLEAAFFGVLGLVVTAAVFRRRLHDLVSKLMGTGA